MDITNISPFSEINDAFEFIKSSSVATVKCVDELYEIALADSKEFIQENNLEQQFEELKLSRAAMAVEEVHMLIKHALSFGSNDDQEERKLLAQEAGKVEEVPEDTFYQYDDVEVRYDGSNHLILCSDSFQPWFIQFTI